jgi:hypothetical protein
MLHVAAQTEGKCHVENQHHHPRADAGQCQTCTASRDQPGTGADAFHCHPKAQCVNNVIGTSFIIANVKWYEAADITFTPTNPLGDKAGTKEDESLGILETGFTKPVLDQNILTGQQSCIGGLKNRMLRVSRK